MDGSASAVWRHKHEGNTGGVMICTRSWLGLSLLDNTEEIVPGRAVAARWQVPGQPAFMVVSAYLVTGKGLDRDNLQFWRRSGKRRQGQVCL